MPYVKRSPSGALIAVSQELIDGFDEHLETDAEELQQFLGDNGAVSAELAGTDLGFVRVIEDVIELLINKNLICFTDLPPAAQDKMLSRQQRRASINSHLDLLGNEEDLF